MSNLTIELPLIFGNVINSWSKALLAHCPTASANNSCFVTDVAKPICLPKKKSEVHPSGEVVIAGWGLTEAGK